MMKSTSFVVSLYKGAICLVGMSFYSGAQATPTVNGTTISWPDNGWYQVQNSSTYESLCEGGRQCVVPLGAYIVINHTTAERFENIEVTNVSSADRPVVVGTTISWPDNGWYQVQDAMTYNSICEGGRSCLVSEGTYNVINLTTGQRFEGIDVEDAGDNANNGNNHGVRDGVYPARINIDDSSIVTELPPWTFNGEIVAGDYVADMDGDGQKDFVFTTDSAAAAPCESQVVVLSSLADGIHLTDQDLPDTLQISNSLFADRGFDEQGCFNLDTVDNALDINGDGLEDLAVFAQVDYPFTGETLYQISAVVFGARTGAVRDVATLDGQNGFTITDSNGLIDGVGDVNGDGYGDYGFRNSGFYVLTQTRLLAGAASLPARREGRDILDAEPLASFERGAVLRPLGDINGDGLADFSARRVPFGARIVLGTSSGTLVTDNPGFASVHAVGDHDADGYDDFLVSRLVSGVCGFNGQISSTVYGAANLSFLESTLDISEFDSPGQTRLLGTNDNVCGMLGAVRLGDVNGDGAEDMLTAGNVLFGTPGRRSALIVASDLDGTNGFRVSGMGYSQISGVDIDADGFSDLIIKQTDNESMQPRWLIAGMPGILFDPQGPRDIVVQVRDGEWTVHWQSASSSAQTHTLSLNNYELGMTGNATSTIISDSLLNEGGLLVVSAVDADGVVVGSNTRQVPAYEEFESLSANVLGPKAVELFFNSNTGSSSGYRHLVWRDEVLLDQSSPAGAGGYFDSSVQPGQIYRYFIQPDYLLGNTFNVSNLTRWPLLQRQSREVEAWTPLEGVDIPPAGSGVLMADGNTLYWPDDGTYRVTDTSTGSVICEGGLACVVSNGRYDVVNLTTGKTYNGIVVSAAGGGENPDGVVPLSPANVTFDIYSSRVAELFWDRPLASDRVTSTEVYRDGVYLGATRGNSYYDGTREEGIAHWYELVAVDADGDRSSAATLNFQRAVQTLLPDNTDNLGSFDYETALNGDIAAIGSTAGFHAVSILEREGVSGNWSIVQKIEPDPSESFEPYGSHIALDGDTLVVLGSNVAANEFDANVLYIYSRDGNGSWRETQRIDNAVNDRDSVAINSDTMAVRRLNGVEMFVRDAGSGQWNSVQFIRIGFDSRYPDRALVLAEGRLAVGVTGHTDNGTTTGAAYIYRQAANGMWELEQQLVPDIASTDLYAGMSIGFDGSSLALSMSDARIVVFSRDGTAWTQTTIIDALGPSYVIPVLAMDNDHLLVGLREANGLTSYTGVVVVFEKNTADSWVERTRLVPSGGDDRFFGTSVSIDGSEVLVGAGSNSIDNGLFASVPIGYLFELD